MSNLMTFLGSVLIFSACQKPVDLGNRTFVGASRLGDVLHVDINKDQVNLQLEGKMRGPALRGTLQPMSKGENFVYKLKEIPGIKIAMLPDDLFIYGTKTGHAMFGVGLYSHRKRYNADEIAGMYNFVLQYIPENFNKFSYGTFELGADKSWRAWRMADGLGGKIKPGLSGHWVDSGEGVIQAFVDNNQKLFANLAMSEDGHDLMVINVVAKNGLALGVRRKMIIPGSVNGEYNVLASKGNNIKIANVHNETVIQGKKHLKITYNKPWEGFFMDSSGEILGIISPKGTCFGLNIGAISGSQFIFAAVKNF